MAVTHTERVSTSMNLAARCINASRVEIDYALLAQELKHTYDSNKDRVGPELIQQMGRSLAQWELSH